jgi:uncharacterized protein (DUF3820 family)
MSKQNSVVDYVLPFGKHKGRRLYDIVMTDPLYLDWLADQPFLTSETKETLKAFLAIDWVSHFVDEALESDEDD